MGDKGGGGEEHRHFRLSIPDNTWKLMGHDNVRTDPA